MNSAFEPKSKTNIAIPILAFLAAVTGSFVGPIVMPKTTATIVATQDQMEAATSSIAKAIKFDVRRAITPQQEVDLHLENFRNASDPPLQADSLAMARMIATASVGDTIFALGSYKMTSTIVLNKEIKLRCAGAYFSRGGGPGMMFEPNISAVRIDAQGATIEHCSFYSRPSPTGVVDPTKHGIIAPWKFVMHESRVSRFPGNCVHVESPTTLWNGTKGGNANGLKITGGMLDYCGQNGIFFRGGDSNAARIISVDIEGNGKWGIYDDSFLGINVFGGQFHANKGDGVVNGVGGAIFATGSGNNQTSIYVGNYIEMDNAARIDGRSAWFGMGPAYGSGNIMLTEGGGLRGSHFRSVGPVVLKNPNLPFDPVTNPRIPEVYAQLGWAQHTALAFGEINKQPFTIGRSMEPTLAGIWTLASAAAPSKPMLGFVGPGAQYPAGMLAMPSRHLIGIGPLAPYQGYGNTPPTAQDTATPWTLGSKFTALRPIPGGIETWRLTAISGTGALTWKVANRLEQ